MADTVSGSAGVGEPVIELTDAQRSQFDRDGFTRVRVFSDDDLAAVQTELEGLVQETMDGLGLGDCGRDAAFDKRLMEVPPADAPTLYRPELHRPGLFSMFGNPRLLSVVQSLMPAAKSIRIYPNYSSRPKLPDSEFHAVVWHQDAGLAADGSPSTAPVAERMEAFGTIVNVWAPLVPARKENGAMQFIPGSHKLGIQPHERLGAYHDGSDGKGKSEIGKYFTQIAGPSLEPHLSKAIDVEVDPGEVVLFSNLLFHRGGTNSSDHIRWSLDWRYQDGAFPTYRAENGHVMWSSDPSVPVVRSGEEWAGLSLS